jgi:hypothetical protein
MCAWTFWENRSAMSGEHDPQAADLAAEQVEAIVAAAQAAAQRITDEAERGAEAIRARGRRDAEEELERARKQALEFDADTRREAKRLVDEALRESRQIKAQTRRAVEGRVAGAEEAAAQVLEEAHALSTGLHRLGQLLGEQGERILREVRAAHQRMQADLRVGPPDADEPPEPRPRTARVARDRATAPRRDDLQVPTWVLRRES